MRPILATEGLGKLFRNGTKALDGVDLVVEEGSFVSIVGPSGCGKSTLLKIVAGLSEASAGALKWHDPGAREGISFVFQEPTLMSWATVSENIYLPLRLAGEKRAEVAPRIAQAIEAVGLGGFELSYPRELSGGMKMRVSIARALVTRPRLLLLDEPFAALDEITRLKLNEDLLKLWQEQGWTVLFVTHSVYESVYLSSRVAVMTKRPGRIAADVAIDLPYPRDAATRVSPAYGEYCREISGQLAEAMG